MASPALIELKDVTKIYRMGNVEVGALRGVSVNIEAGTWWPLWALPAPASPP